jgi:hypothetical protein
MSRRTSFERSSGGEELQAEVLAVDDDPEPDAAEPSRGGALGEEVVEAGGDRDRLAAAGVGLEQDLLGEPAASRVERGSPDVGVDETADHRLGGTGADVVGGRLRGRDVGRIRPGERVLQDRVEVDALELQRAGPCRPARPP